MNSSTIIIAGIIVILIGFIITILGTALQSTSNNNNQSGEVKTGGVLLIGPIPIIFGNDKSFIILGATLAIILMVLAYILFYRPLT